MMHLLTITDIPSHIFGTSSHLMQGATAHGVAQGVLGAPSGDSLWYVVATLVVAALYLEWVNQWSIKGANHVRSFRFLGSHRGGYSAKSEVMTPSYSEYSRIASLVGYLVVWLFLLRIIEFSGFDVSHLITSHYSPLWLVVLVPAIFLYQALVVWLITLTTRDFELKSQIMRLKSVIFTIFVIVTSPALLCFMAGGNLWQTPLLYVVVAVTIAVLLLYIYEYFLLFLSKKVSILHTILYLCTVEIFPISLIWGYFNRVN